MRLRRIPLFVVLTVILGSMPASPASQQLTLEERLDAQDTIERVYYSHQIGATRAFEQAVPRSLLVRKVRTYMLESWLLETRWNRPLSYFDLSNEWHRIRRSSRFPDRLAAIEHALHDDPDLILECFVRPILADRLARDYFSRDPQIHRAPRLRAEQARTRLADRSGSDSSVDTEFVVDIVESSAVDESVAGESQSHPSSSATDGIERRIVSPSEFADWTRRVARASGDVGIEEDSDAYTVFVVLSRSPSTIRVGSHRVPKESWDEWKDQLLEDPDPNAITSRSDVEDTISVSRSGSKDASVSGVPESPHFEGSSSGATGLLLDTGTWSPTSLTNAPSGRFRHTAIWTGNVMVVWGGQTDFGVANTGGRYDPLTDSWTPTSTINAPAARTDHTTVWTGQRMVVWGGGGQSFPDLVFAPGGRYDPIADQWTAVSTTGQPEYRRGLTSVWTGTEMIIWGGRAAGSTFPSVGGRYNPTNDTWTLTSTLNAPAGVELFPSVWTGTEMIVWGGQDGSGPSAVKGTGGRYNPSLDQWSPTSLVNAPSPRSFHSGVWTGSRMIIWGGLNYNAWLNSGAQYDPSANSWTPTSTSAAPSPRESAVALWTGTEMFIWSGYDGGMNFNDGGRYNPAFDSWTPLTTANAPVPRRHSMGVWIGRAIVWGGYPPMNTGGKYQLGPDADGDGFETPEDCNDSDPSVYPGAPQVCDGKNNNCSDPDWPTVPPSERDTDGDHYRSCSGDCDDSDPSVYPGAPQVCDGRNNNCSDPDWPTVPPSERDTDGDGYRTCSGDCNDTNPNVHPGADEVCDERDNDCDGQVDEDALGVDSDGDTVHNACDNCRLVYNSGQLDSDTDGVGNSCDNCPFSTNHDQADADSDGVGDACDDCPMDYNPNQSDQDMDRWGDECDNCPFSSNSNQANFDHDAEGDVCDLNDGLILFTLVSKNGAIWQLESGYQVFNLYRGSLERLLATGEYSQDPSMEPRAFHWCSLTSNQQADGQRPPIESVNFYLVSGENTGVEGSLGTRSDGSERPNAHPCP